MDDKQILLLGGGRSKLTKELKGYGITPKEIVNGDPFVENVEEDADRVIPVSASDKDFVEKMREQGVESVDQILAEYSVPAYLEDPGEIQQLIQNIDALLSEGGDARIWPIQVGGRGESQELQERKSALLQSLEKLQASGKYNLVLYKSAGRAGCILHKLTPPREELQRKEDQGKIEDIRTKLGINS
ncbi:MAG: hypothetical protein V1848_01365 [Candidatus Magasanikbacteria bacterium]